MSRPMTRLMTTAVATRPAPESGRRWGLRPTTPPAAPDRSDEGHGAEGPAPFWEYYCLAFC